MTFFSRLMEALLPIPLIFQTKVSRLLIITRRYGVNELVFDLVMRSELGCEGPIFFRALDLGFTT